MTLYQADQFDQELAAFVREQLETRTSVAEYEIVEATAGHVLVRVREVHDQSEGVLDIYRVTKEPGPGDTVNVHWELLVERPEDESEE
ncbi:MAG: hypothetical protein ABEI98_05865 [Halorhabdus sp.]